MSMHVCLCTSVTCIATHLAQTLWNPSLLCIIPLAEPWLIFRTCATSSVVTRLSNRTMSHTRSILCSVMALDGRPAPLSCVIFVRSFLYFQSICRHSVPAIHCFRILPKDFDRLWHWYTFRPQKTGSLNVALLWCTQKALQPWLTARRRRWN